MAIESTRMTGSAAVACALWMMADATTSGAARVLASARLAAEAPDAPFRAWFISETGAARAVGVPADDLSADGSVVGGTESGIGWLNFSRLGDDVVSTVDDSAIGPGGFAALPVIRGNTAAMLVTRDTSPSSFATMAYFATVGQLAATPTCEVQTASLPRFSSAAITDDAHILRAMTETDGSGPTAWTVIRAPFDGPCGRVGQFELVLHESVVDLAPWNDGDVLLLIRRQGSQEHSGRVLSMTEAGVISEVAQPFHPAWGPPTFVKTHLKSIYIGFDGNTGITLTRLDGDLQPLTLCLSRANSGLALEPGT